MKRVMIVVVALAAAGLALWWWRTRVEDSRATSTVSRAAKPEVASARGPGAQPASARLSVVVKNAKGPIQGAIVRIDSDDDEPSALVTDASGRVIAASLAPGAYRVSAAAPGHLPAAAPIRELASNDDAAIEIVLVAGGVRLSGTITDATGGVVAGARIDAARQLAVFGAQPDAAVASTLSTPDGRYELTVPQGLVVVVASSADYAAQSRIAEVGPAGAVVDFALVPGGVIEGVVRHVRTRAPVAGISVRAAPERGGRPGLERAGPSRAVADAQGRFRFSGLRPGVYELSAFEGALSSTAPTMIGIGVAEQVTDVEILVNDALSIKGTVLDTENKPVSGVSITMFARDSGNGDGDVATSAADGTFEIRGVNAGTYTLMGSSKDHLDGGMVEVLVEDKDVTGVVVHVSRGIVLEGRVEPPQVCDVSYEADDDEGSHSLLGVAPVTTTEDGKFTLQPLGARKAILHARCMTGAFGSLAVDVRAGIAPVVIAVKPGASIAGRVLDGDRKPVVGVTVMGQREEKTVRTTIVNGMVTGGVQALTDGHGAYRLEGLSEGSYTMNVLERGRPLRPSGKPVKTKVGATEAKTGVDLVVDRATGVIKGVVTGHDGKPMKDAWVSVQQDVHTMVEDMMNRGDPEEGQSRMMTLQVSDDGTPSAIAPALTDSEGRFAIGGLAHGKYEVIAEAQAGKLRGRIASVTPDATVTVQVLGVTTLSGKVTGPNGPVKMFHVEIEGPTTAARSFTDGAYSLGRVDPGTYRVRVSSTDGNAEGSVVVAPNQPATLDLVLVANAVVVGTVVDKDGKPVPALSVALIPDEGEHGRLSISIEGPPPQTGPDGRFRIEGKAGPMAIVVLGPPRPTVKRGLKLEPGKTLDVGQIVMGAEPSPK